MDVLNLSLFNWSEIAILYSINVFIAMVIITCTWVLYRLTKKPLALLLDKTDLDDYFVSILVESIYRSAIMFIGIVTALSQVGVNIIAALAGFGIVGIAVGFAAKDALANVIAGFMIFFDKPFRVGDWVESDGEYGQIDAITLRSTRIHTISNFHVVIPNQTIINTTLVNHHKLRHVSVATHFFLPYRSDTRKAIEILKESASTVEGVIPDSKISAGITNWEMGMVKVGVYVSVPNAKSAIGMDARIRLAGKEALERAGFPIAYPITLSSKPR